MKLILIFISCSLSLKVYYSTLSNDDKNKTSGLKYLQEYQKSLSFTNNLPFCARFNYIRLNVVLFRAYSKNTSENSFVGLRIAYPQSFFAIGDRLKEKIFWVLDCKRSKNK